MDYNREVRRATHDTMTLLVAAVGYELIFDKNYLYLLLCPFVFYSISIALYPIFFHFFLCYDLYLVC